MLMSIYCNTFILAFHFVSPSWTPESNHFFRFFTRGGRFQKSDFLVPTYYFANFPKHLVRLCVNGVGSFPFDFLPDSLVNKAVHVRVMELLDNPAELIRLNRWTVGNGFFHCQILIVVHIVTHIEVFFLAISVFPPLIAKQ
jgi:hypothetical protein